MIVSRDARTVTFVTTTSEVLIAGAGPVGLWLAAELRLHGVDVVILERNAEPARHPKALGLHARTLEQFASRGVVDTFLAEGVRVPAWHFGFLEQALDLTVLDSPYPFLLSQPQNRTEALLTERALALGARIERGQEVIELSQDDDGVLVRTAAGGDWRAGWVVGADGAGSTVRRAAGIGFPGSDATVFGFLGDVHADSAPPPGYRVQNERGALIVAPLPGGLVRVTGFDPLDQEPGRREITLGELREVSARISGTDFGLRDPAWLSRFGNATRVAASYRSGRVLLAGDAAHMHFPAGGVGLNLGLQDATNLGWKLAAALRGRFRQALPDNHQARPGTHEDLLGTHEDLLGTHEDLLGTHEDLLGTHEDLLDTHEDLLDTYESERRPWAEDVAEHTLAQTALITGIDPTGQALRRVMSSLIGSTPELSLSLARRLSGVSVRYPAPEGAHPLVGTHLSGLDLREARPVLLRGADVPAGVGATAVLVRPDGYVAWATNNPQTNDSHPGEDARRALATWGLPL
jgi:2-polyprenyl-6-methoxyphenol hydroxylase-like FAD-dependent oxidoreductase